MKTIIFNNCESLKTIELPPTIEIISYVKYIDELSDDEFGYIQKMNIDINNSGIAGYYVIINKKDFEAYLKMKQL